MPFASAVLLSVAAGLSLAAEHVGAPAAAGAAPGPPVVLSNSLNEGPAVRAAPRGAGPSQRRGAGSRAAAPSRPQAGAPGVGSRAFTGNDRPAAAPQPEVATGVDLKGQPMRFAPVDVPE
jgi:hypothetical protein